MADIFSNFIMSNLQLQERKYAILHDDALKELLHILLCLSDKLRPNHPRQELLLLSSHLRYLFPKLSVAINFLTREKYYLAEDLNLKIPTVPFTIDSVPGLESMKS